MKLALVLTLCLLSSAAAQKTPSRIGPTSGRIQTDCTCDGGVMDCTSKGKTTFTRNERCPNAVSKLLLFNNSISTLPRDAFASMTELTDLYLQDNILGELPRDVFSGLTNLSRLLLQSAQLTTLPEGIFQNLNNLQEIALWGNNFRNIPNRLFAGLRKLTSAILSDNHLTTLPADTFMGITTMEIIDLARNNLTHIPRGLFRGMESVRFLDLSDNQLTQISSEELISIRHMFRLDLIGNRITTIPRYDANWPQITFSFFGGNDIKRANEEVLRSWLGNGNSTRLLSMEGSNSTYVHFPPEDLKWAVSDNNLSKQVTPRDCRCGMIILRNAAVAICVNVECGGGRPHDDWVSAVRALSGSNRSQGGGRPTTTRGNTKG